MYVYLSGLLLSVYLRRQDRTKQRRDKTRQYKAKKRLGNEAGVENGPKCTSEERDFLPWVTFGILSPNQAPTHTRGSFISSLSFSWPLIKPSSKAEQLTTNNNHLFDKNEHLDILSSKTIWFSVCSFSTDRNLYMFSLDLIAHTLYTNVVNHVYQYDNKVVLFRDNLLRQYYQ